MKIDRRWFICAAAGLAAVARPALAQDLTDAEYQAASAAITLSRYEATADYGSLVQEMHLDCQVLVPSAVVYGWYRDAFAPRQPGIISEVTGVRMVSWTWAGNGKTYPQTAEVSFVQSFGAGPVADKVRLVKEHGRWRWFFGRDVDFINSQIALYAPNYPPIAADRGTAIVTGLGTAPWGIESIVRDSRAPDTVLAALPAAVAGNHRQSAPMTDTAGRFSFAVSSVAYQYTGPSDPVMPTGAFGVYGLERGVSPAGATDRIKENGAAASPASTVMRDGVGDRTQVPYLLITQYTGDAVGFAPFLYWGAADGRWLYAATMLELASLRLLVQKTVAAL